jgi:hypothetical protein
MKNRSPVNIESEKVTAVFLYGAKGRSEYGFDLTIDSF